MHYFRRKTPKAEPAASAPSALPRRDRKMQSSLQQPQYRVSLGQSRFERSEGGKRLAPVSQLNTPTGRRLAQVHNNSDCLSPTEDVTQDSEGFVDKNDFPELRIRGYQFRNHTQETLRTGIQPLRKDPQSVPKHQTSRPLSHRDRLPSQRPYTELPQLLGLNRTCSSIKDSSDIGSRYPAEARPKPVPAPPACPDCQGPNGTNYSSQAGQICKTCNRFLPVAKITALVQKPLPPIPKMAPPAPKRISFGPLCRSCLSIPGYLYEEFLHFLPNCASCGHLTDELLFDLISSGGELTSYGSLKSVGKARLRPSKELQDWCYYIAHFSRYRSKAVDDNVSRQDSGKSLTSMKSNTSLSSLKRQRAIRRSETSSTKSSASTQEGVKLIPVEKIKGGKMRYERHFSWQAKDGKDAENHDQRGGMEDSKGPRSAPCNSEFGGSDMTVRQSHVPRRHPKLVGCHDVVGGTFLSSVFGSLRLESPGLGVDDHGLSNDVKDEDRAEKSGRSDQNRLPQVDSEPPARPRSPKRTFSDILGEPRYVSALSERETDN